MRLKIASHDIFVVIGAKNVEALWRRTTQTSGTPLFCFSLQKLFGLKKEAARMYHDDNSGCLARPHPKSRVAPEGRIDYKMHHAVHTLLQGPEVTQFVERFENLLTETLNKAPIETEWSQHADLLEFMQINTITATVTASHGPKFLSLNPKFPQIFWEFNEWIPYFAKLLPRFAIPKAYHLRDTLLLNIKEWQEYVLDQENKPDVDTSMHWGNEFFRKRFQILLNAHEGDMDAMASEDLGLIWG